MVKYHLNYKGEAGQCSATTGRCPFGDESDHFDTPALARTAYEGAQNSFALTLKKTLPRASDNDVLRYERMEANINGKLSASELAEADGFDGADVKARLDNINQDRLFVANEARMKADKNPHSIGDELEAQELEKIAGLNKKAPSEILRDLDLDGATLQQLEDRKAEIFKKSFSEMTDADHIEVAAIASEQEQRAYVSAESNTWESFKVPKVEDSKIIAKPKANDNEGYLGGRRWIGGRVPDTGYLSQKEAAKLIRGDIKAAVKAGELPKDMDYSVRMAKGAWVTSIDVVLGTKNESGRPKVVTDDEAKNPNMERVSKYLEALGNQYSTDDSNAQVDYFNSHNRVRVSHRSQWT